MNNFKPDNGGGGVQVEGVLPPSAVVPMPRKMRSWLWLLVIFLPLGIIATVGFHVNFGQTPFFAQQIVLGTETVAGDAALSIDATMISSSLTIT
ncbi:MAG: hypothetical protein FWB71_06005, partial [Defluviitaleaceae bacterium]|nr:hypothetical protein [Defluviitaleaceae bacterium]